MELVKKLGIIQQKLNAPKSQHNKFGNYNYRNCEDIMQALKPLLGDCIVLMPSVAMDFETLTKLLDIIEDTLIKDLPAFIKEC